MTKDITTRPYALVAFIPAIHKGYIDLFKKYPGELYLLSKSFIPDVPFIERDLRTPDMDDLKKILSAVGVTEVHELSPETISSVPRDAVLVMPDDSITRTIAEKYFSDREVVFDTVFLRWNKQITKREMVVAPNRIISEEERDREFMNEAEVHAEKSSDWWRRIGAVCVKDGSVLVSGYNKHLPSDFNLDAYGDPRSSFDAGESFEISTAIHCEATLVAEAARKGISLEGSSLYVTTFPCPVCAKLVSEAGIKKVYYKNGYSLVDAESILQSFGIEIVLVKNKLS